ncbi:MAG: hypothetical protein Q7U71_06050 [bacterium]|nr:hypothetical protein [bacterium]
MKPKIFLFAVCISAAVIGCASLPRLEKRLLSENDGVVVKARADLDTIWNTQKLIEISRDLMPKAKYGNKRQSLMAFQALSSMYVSGGHLFMRGYPVVGLVTPLTIEIGKQGLLLQQLDDYCIDNYLAAIENGNPETKIFCIEILSEARPIYTKTVDYLINLLYRDWEEPAYHAYRALKIIRTLQAQEAVAKFEANNKNKYMLFRD